MIPTIETILRDLKDGTITYEEALGWINEHLKLAAAPNTSPTKEGT